MTLINYLHLSKGIQKLIGVRTIREGALTEIVRYIFTAHFKILWVSHEKVYYCQYRKDLPKESSRNVLLRITIFKPICNYESDYLLHFRSLCRLCLIFQALNIKFCPKSVRIVSKQPIVYGLQHFVRFFLNMKDFNVQKIFLVQCHVRRLPKSF